jgi:6-phosphogluconolactonase
MVEIRRLSSPEEVVSEAAALAAADLKKALDSNGSATFVLAGGRLPPLANDILAKKYADAFDWQRIRFLIGDERCVPLDNPDSSWLSIQSMFDLHPEIPEENKQRPQSQLPAEAAAVMYAKVLQTLPKNQSGLPIIDLLWLGVGEDGHTLSLFPNHSSFTQARETGALVIPVHDSPKPPSDRISFALKTLEGVALAMVLVSGVGKAPIMAQIANGDHSLPIVVASQTIERAGGHVIWLVDEDALSQIPAEQTLAL